MANDFLSELGRRAPQIALAFLAARQGGPASAAAFQQGMLRAQQQRDAQARQAQMDEERRSAQAAQEARLTNADARAEESARIAKVQSALQFLNQYAQQQGETAPDAVSAENALLSRSTALEGMFGVPQGQLSAAIPNMAPTISRRQKKLAQETYERAEKTYGPEAMANDGITLTTDAFGQVKPSALRHMFTPQAVTATGEPAKPYVKPPDTPNTPEEQQIADAFAVAESTKGAPLTPQERMTARTSAMAGVSGARRKPEDAELKDIQRQLAETRLDIAKSGKEAGRSPLQIATFNQIAGAYEHSPLIRASDRTIVLADAIKAIEKNPTDPASQLSLAYSYIQALDTYQSAVREGELGNLGILGTRLQGFVTALRRVADEGAFLPPEVAVNIAQNAKQLAQTIETGRQRKQQEFASRARVSGVGDMWDQFVGGFASGGVEGWAESGVQGFQIREKR